MGEQEQGSPIKDKQFTPVNKETLTTYCRYSEAVITLQAEGCQMCVFYIHLTLLHFLKLDILQIANTQLNKI